MAGRDLAPRMTVVAIGLPTAVWVVHLGGWPLGAVAALCAGIGTSEFYALSRARGLHPFSPLGVAASALIVLMAVALPRPIWVGPWVAGVLLVVVLASLALAVRRRRPNDTTVASVGATALGVVYVGLPLAFLPILRALPETFPSATFGGGWRDALFVLLPLGVVWAGDTAAYFVGSAWGRTKLAPTVSPGKTVLGGVAGLIASGLAAALIVAWGLTGSSGLTLPMMTAVAIGMGVGAVGQVGDLVVSVLKREAMVKDSGRVFPGHGGMLDRLDALLFALPVTWLLVRLAGVVPGGAS